ncbi:MAG: LPS assembly lipoprotein LptE [Halofilum sp. (in: g-proteobacteria)]
MARQPRGTSLSGCRPDLQDVPVPTYNRARLVAILILATILTACGWHLRGSYDLPPEVTPVAVDGGGGVANELRDSLRATGALARSAEEPAASRLEILEENESRRVLSVDADGKVNEYEVRYEVRWQLTAKGSDDKSRRILIAPGTLEANRSYDYSANAVLSRDEQEKRLIENTRADIARRILFRLRGLRVGDQESASRDQGDAGND